MKAKSPCVEVLASYLATVHLARCSVYPRVLRTAISSKGGLQSCDQLRVGFTQVVHAHR